jgi:DNA-directed RNA polymerase subunit N
MILKQELKDKNLTDRKMIIPIRCFSCGKPVGHLWEKYLEQINAGEDPKKVMDDLDIERYCCRALFMGHVDMLEDIAQFKKF